MPPDTHADTVACDLSNPWIYTHSYQRVESSNRPHSVSSGINHVSWLWIICAEGFGPGETEAETAGWMGSLGPERVAPPPCVYVCTAPHAKIPPSLSTLSPTQADSTKEDLKPLPLTLHSAHVSYSSVWQANMDSHSLSSVFIHIHLYIVLPWRPFGLSLTLVYTDVQCIYLTAVRAQGDPPTRWPLVSHKESHLVQPASPSEVIHL